MLITGGTGSFGKAFVKRLLDQGIEKRICIYSRDEFKQAQMRDEFQDDERLRFFVGDVRDRDRLKRAMQGVLVVVHAAALKRIEVGNYAPDEMVKTNIIGSMNVIEAAFDAKVKKVVALSTDKAYQPISPYGQSKAIAESLFINANNSHIGPRFSCVRYGNVAGSKGSIIPKWRELIKENKLGIATNLDCTRFWMYMSEAVDLVKMTIETMKGGEMNIAKLPAYRLGDLAIAMGISVTEIGLPEFEKKHECMAGGNCSNTAYRMTVEEIKKALDRV